MYFGEQAKITGFQVLKVNFQKVDKRYVTGRPFYGLTFRYSGKIRVETQEDSLLSEPRTVTFIPMNQDYETEILEDGQMIAVHFTMIDAPQDLRPQVKPVSDALGQRFLHLWKQYQSAGKPDFRCLALLYEILAELAAQNSAGLGVGPIAEMRAYMVRHFNNTELNVSAVAEHFGISDSYLRREFKKAFGIPPSAFLQILRIDHAKMLLRSGYYAVKQVAELCGFGSVSYFSSAFRHAVGCSPLEYRDNK